MMNFFSRSNQPEGHSNRSNTSSSDAITNVTQLIRGAFHGLDENTIDELRQIGQNKKYKSGVILCEQGEIGSRFFVILGGRVAVSQHAQNGDEVVVGTIGKGKYFGELSLLDDHPNSARCTTITEVSVLELDKAQFQHMVSSYPSIATSLLKTILTRMREDDARAISVLIEKNVELEEAYNQLKITQAELLQAERYQRELELAAEVQRDLLPTKFPEIEGYQCASYLGSLQATGNFFDVIKLNEEYVGILLGDVADVGIQASMFMAVARTLFGVESQRSLSPFDVTLAVHDGLNNLSSREDLFVKTFYGVLHRPTGMFSYVVAGHSQPLLYRKTGEVGQLSGQGGYLGQTRTLHTAEKRTRLHSGDRLVLFSDGVIDCENAAGLSFGYPQFRELVRRHATLHADALITELQQEIWMWQAGSLNHTGFAMLVITVD